MVFILFLFDKKTKFSFKEIKKPKNSFSSPLIEELFDDDTKFVKICLEHGGNRSCSLIFDLQFPIRGVFLSVLRSHEGVL